MSERFVKKAVLLLFIIGSVMNNAAGVIDKANIHRLLYITAAAGYRHESIDTSKAILTDIGNHSGAFEATATDDLGEINSGSLKNYNAVMFYTFGEIPMNDDQKQALVDFIRSGHGFIGIHSTGKTLQQWSTFAEILGGHFGGKSLQQDVKIDVTDPSNEIVKFLHGPFEVDDEVYQMINLEPKTDVLLRLDAASAGTTAGADPGNWPVAWTRKYGRGRVYYNCLGHKATLWQDLRFQTMLLNGIKWVMGESK